MKNYLKIIAGFIAGASLMVTLLGWVATAQANPYIPFQGGTGSSSTPSLGQILVGNPSSSYTPTTTLPSAISVIGGLLNASGTHIATTYSYVVSPVAGEGDYTNIQSAINADCALTSPGLIFVKKGNYSLGGTGLTVSSTCSGFGLIGETESSTRISYMGSGDAIRLGDASGTILYAQLKNFTISGSGSGLNGIHAERVQTADIENLYITGFTKTSTSSYDAQGKAIDLDGMGSLAADNYFSNIHADHNDIDLLIASTSNANYFSGLDFYGQTNPSSTLILIQNGVGNHLDITNLSSATNGVIDETQKDYINSVYNELLTTAFWFTGTGTNNELHYNQMANVTTTVFDQSAGGTNQIFSSNGTVLSGTTVANGLSVTGNATIGNGVTVSSTGNGYMSVYRAGTLNYDTISLGNPVGTDRWCIQLKNDGTNTLHIIDCQNGGDVFTAVVNGSTTINAPNGGSIILGTTTVVSNGVLLDPSGNKYVTSTSAGAGTVTTSSATSTGYFPSWVTASGLSVTSSIYQASSSGKVGINTTAPGSTLDVNGFINASSGFNQNNTLALLSTANNTYVGLTFTPNIPNGTGNLGIGPDTFLNLSSSSANNTGIGYQSLGVVNGGTTISNDTGIGEGALQDISSNGNTCVGFQCLWRVKTGSFNIGIGNEADPVLYSGSNNIVIGNNIQLPATSTTSTLDIANFIYATGLSDYAADATTTSQKATSTISAGHLSIGTTTPNGIANFNGNVNVNGNVTSTGLTDTGNLLGSDNVAHTVQSLASSSVTFMFQNATTTEPYSFESVPNASAKTIAKVDCWEYAAATTTIELYYETSSATSSLSSGNVVLSSITCGINGASTNSFTTSSLPINSYLFAIVSSTAGTPTLTTVNVYATKL